MLQQNTRNVRELDTRIQCRSCSGLLLDTVGDLYVEWEDKVDEHGVPHSSRFTGPELVGWLKGGDYRPARPLELEGLTSIAVKHLGLSVKEIMEHPDISWPSVIDNDFSMLNVSPSAAVTDEGCRYYLWVCERNLGPAPRGAKGRQWTKLPALVKHRAPMASGPTWCRWTVVDPN